MTRRMVGAGRGLYNYLHRSKRLVWALSVALVFYVFWELSPDQQQGIDPWIVLAIGIVKQVIVLFMLLFTARWSWRSIGVMSVMQGVAILYLGSAFLYWHQEDIPRYGEAVTDLGRAFLIVGLTPLLLGVIRYGYDVVRIGRSHRNVAEL